MCMYVYKYILCTCMCSLTLLRGSKSSDTSVAVNTSIATALVDPVSDVGKVPNEPETS